jgi:phenylalanyl-tRNA synthetase beta chain
MYTSLDWINEFVNLETIELEDLINKLTLGGFEVEEILKIDRNKTQKTILDISATANRADSLSIKGIGQEITSLLNQPLNNSKYTSKDSPSFINLEKAILTDNINCGCSILVAITVENLVDLSVPKWLKEKLICSKIEPKNNLLDFQTYITLETGYPFEFYDLQKIQEKIKSSKFKLNLNFASENDLFIGSNNLEYKLKPNITMLNANNYPLSIGGIISNNEIAYTSQTKSLLIEASIFTSQQIRQQSRMLGLRTERSARYEKGLNKSYFIDALVRLLLLLKTTNPNLRYKLHTATQISHEKTPSITLRYKNIIEILGPIKDYKTNKLINLKPEQIDEYLKRLNFSFIFNAEKETWNIDIPLFRADDIQREIDIIEEVGRLHGFNNFVTQLPIVSKIGIEDASYQTRKKLTACFLNEGLNELIQYSLANDNSENSVELINPLIKDYSKLRQTLLPSLIKTVSENLKQSNIVVEGFEYGHVFLGTVPQAYTEEEVVSGIFGGVKRKRQWNETAVSLSWFEAKGKIEDLFNKLNFVVTWQPSTIEKYKTILHPYRTAELWLNSNYFLGVFGQVHPMIVKSQNLPKDLFLFELNLDVIKHTFENQKLALYKPYSIYPKITKDLSFLIDQNISFDAIRKLIWKNGSEYLTNISLLDEYRGSNIPNHQTSLCIQLTFQATQKTLTTKEIEEIINNIQTILENEFKISIRI